MAYISTSNLECSICTSLYIDAVSLPCAHNFCKKCILDHLEENQACPLCNKPAKKRDVEPDGKLRQIINNISARPSMCHDCKAQTEQLQRCADCSNDLCEPCLKIHLNKLKLDIENWFKEKAPKRREVLAGYFERLSEIEAHIDEFTKSAETSLTQHHAKLMQKLNRMADCGQDIELILAQQLNEANNLLKRAENLISESSRGTILDSNEVDDLLLEVDKLESRFNKFSSDRSNRSLEIPLTEHTIQCLRELNILEKRSLM